MLHQWNTLWSSLGGNSSGVAIYDFLKMHYNRCTRHYHDFAHIGRCLELTQEIRDSLHRPDVFEFAFWFHDVIYETRGKGNEERSAELAAAMLALTKHGDLASMATRYILATKHDAVPVLEDEQYFVDIDLAILGAPVVKFDEYELQIRREYDWVSEGDFKMGRAQILQGFLGRSKIYQTRHFSAQFEDQARANLTRSIAQLTCA